MLQIDVTQSCVMQLWNVLHSSASLSCEANIQLCDLSQMQMCGVPHIGLVVTLVCYTWMLPCGVLHIGQRCNCGVLHICHICNHVVCYTQIVRFGVLHIGVTLWCATHRSQCNCVVCYTQVVHLVCYTQVLPSGALH